MNKSKYKLKVDFKELKEVLSIPIIRNSLKKEDIVELIDDKNGINKRCKIEKITNLDNNPYYQKVHFSTSPFEFAVISTKGLGA